MSIHPDLLPLLEVWVAELKAGEPLFPGLDRKKTWLMVKKDLECAGIPYWTGGGVADFHAIGRRSFIQSLLDGGVKVHKVMDLARHSDIRMTMRYEQTRFDEQAREFSVVRAPVFGAENVGQHIGSDLRGPGRPDVSQPDPNGGREGAECAAEKPGGDRACDATCPSVSASSTEGAQMEAAGL